VRERHDRGVAGDTQAVIDLVADLERWTAEQPNNRLLQAYLASCYTLRSRDAIFYKKMDYLNLAKRTFNEAVDANPNDVAVRFVRAVNLIHLPAIFDTRAMARDDFKQLLKILEGQAPPSFDAKTRQAIYFYAGLSYEQTQEPKEAQAVWRRGVKIDPASELGKKMAAKLPPPTPSADAPPEVSQRRPD